MEIVKRESSGVITIEGIKSNLISKRVSFLVPEMHQRGAIDSLNAVVETICLNPFQNHRIALPHTNTHGCQSVPFVLQV